MLIALISLGAIQSPAQTETPKFGLQDEIFVVRLLSPLSTKTAKEGDVFTSAVEEPESFKGAIMEGRITRLKKPEKGTGKEKAEMQFRFETLTFKNRTEQVRAELKDVKNSAGKSKVDEEGHVVGVSSNKKRILATLLGAGAGAAVGAATGGAKGAGIGAGAGAAAGLLIGLKMTTAASDIEFKPGSTFTLAVSDTAQ